MCGATRSVVLLFGDFILDVFEKYFAMSRKISNFASPIMSKII